MSFKLINHNLLEIIKELNINESSINETPIEYIPRSYIQTAGNMFTYLNYCPPHVIGLYRILFKDATSREMIVAASNLIKTSRNTEKKIAIAVWHKLMENFGSMYRKIEQITRQEKYENQDALLKEILDFHMTGIYLSTFTLL